MPVGVVLPVMLTVLLPQALALRVALPVGDTVPLPLPVAVPQLESEPVTVGEADDDCEPDGEPVEVCVAQTEADAVPFALADGLEERVAFAVALAV